MAVLRVSTRAGVRLNFHLFGNLADLKDDVD